MRQVRVRDWFCYMKSRGFSLLVFSVTQDQAALSSKLQLSSSSRSEAFLQENTLFDKELYNISECKRAGMFFENLTDCDSIHLLFYTHGYLQKLLCTSFTFEIPIEFMWVNLPKLASLCSSLFILPIPFIFPSTKTVLLQTLTGPAKPTRSFWHQSQNAWVWKAPLEVLWSNPLVQQSHLELVCPWLCPNGFCRSPMGKTRQTLWATCASAQPSSQKKGFPDVQRAQSVSVCGHSGPVTRHYHGKIYRQVRFLP